MGSGPSREIATPQATRELILSPELGPVLDVALQKLDRANPKFKESRDEERYAQITKVWHRLCAEMDGHLRHVAKVLILSHQLALEVGSDGGGVNAKPWIEENAGVLERLYFKLHEGGIVVVCGLRTIATGSVKDVRYEWIERVVVEWAVNCVENPKK